MLETLLKELVSEADDNVDKMEKSYTLEVTSFELDLLKDTLKERSNEDLTDLGMTRLCNLWNKVTKLEKEIHNA